MIPVFGPIGAIGMAVQLTWAGAHVIADASLRVQIAAGIVGGLVLIRWALLPFGR